MRLSSIAVIAVAIVVACGGGDTAGDTSASAGASGAATGAANATPAGNASGSGSCVVGTYTQSSPSFSPKFVFNADGTGEETQAASQGGKTRKFNWQVKNANQLTISFPAEGDQSASSTDWNYSCENGTFASLYKKQ